MPVKKRIFATKMVTSIRIYKRWDTDLLYLFVKGYNVGELASRALHAHVHGEKLRIAIDTIEYFDPKDLRSVHFALNTEDPTVCDFLQSIRPGNRSACVKQILRSAIRTPLCVAYLKNSDYISKIKDAAYALTENDPSMYHPTRTENRVNVLNAFRRAAAAAEASTPATDNHSANEISPADLFEV